MHVPIQLERLDRLFSERPHIVKQFLQLIPLYQPLCIEVAYILEKRIREAGIEFSSIVHRVKSLESFADKIERKNYTDPISETTDFAGVRIVYLYKSDFGKIEQIINTEFNVIEKVDTIKEKGTEKFGYAAVHFLATIGRESSGARYDDLEDMICEIQVLTILQDAWAIIDHHLSYKQESAVPEMLKRNLSRLAALFEDGDDKFDALRREREAYVIEIESKYDHRTDFLKQQIDLDTVKAFLKWRIPTGNFEDDKKLERYISILLEILDQKKYKEKYKTLLDLDSLMDKTQRARKAYSTNIDEKNPPVALIFSMTIVDKALRKKLLPKGEAAGKFDDILHLIDE